MHKNNEILDLVNEDDEIVQTLLRDEIYANNMKYVRVVEIFIKNSEGKLWIPIRGSHKRIAPGGFDIGAAGHVEHGETYKEAMKKEVFEELYWNSDDFNVKEIGKFGPKNGLNTVSMVYEIETDIEPKLNPEDFTSAEWLTPVELSLKIKNGHPAKSNLLPLLKLVYKT